MIKVNVEIESKLWNQKVKSKKKYFNTRLKKISNFIPFFKKKNITFTILLTNSTKMQKLNKKFRNKNKSTDVLSFPNFLYNKLKSTKNKNIYIGDVAVSFSHISKSLTNNNFFFEFDKVWIHGLLHLLGYDHIKNKDYYRMKKVEKKLINKIY